MAIIIWWLSSSTGESIMIDIKMTICKEDGSFYLVMVELNKDNARFRNRVGANRKWNSIKRIPHETVCNFHGRVIRSIITKRD